MKRQLDDRQAAQTPDLQTQYEALLDTVWRCEERARIQDRIEAQARFDAQRQMRRRSAQ
jgi:hypothetical protein